MKIFNKFVLAFFSIFIKFSTQDYIIYPFKKSYKEIKEYPEDLIQNDLEITLKIGTPPQSIDVNLRSKEYTSFITSSEVNLSYPTYNEFNSKSIVKLNNISSTFGGKEYKKGIKISESLTINNKEIKNISLILATSIVYNQSGAIGLKLLNSLDYGYDLTFIYQIKDLLNLDNYAFWLKYDDENDEKGELIIGAYPHTFNKKYKEKNFIIHRADSLGQEVDWIIDFDEIKYDNNLIPGITRKSLIKIEYGLIQAPYTLKEYFNKNFFNNKCNEIDHNLNGITIIHCDKNFNITNFKSLSFILKDIDYIFNLTYKDLFIEKEDEYIFSIVFDNNKESEDTTWIFGKPFMKKYNLVFDLEKKIIGMYTQKDDKNESKNKELYIYIIVIVILVLIIIGLAITVIYCFKKYRKNKAFELIDDNFEYISSN